jgi:hypothetical protein
MTAPNGMRGSRARLAAASLAAVGIAAAFAYATLPRDSRAAGEVQFAGVSGVREVVGKQVYDSASSKIALAQCRAGEAAVGGGYLLAGDFQRGSSPSIPVVTESGPAYRGDIAPGKPPRLWSIHATAPSTLSGPWGLTAKAICVKAAR